MDVRWLAFALLLASAACRSPREDEGEGVLESPPITPGGAAKPESQPAGTPQGERPLR